MLLTAFTILSAVVVVGLGLTLFHLGLVTRRWWTVGVLHGIGGAVGLGVLLFALRGPVRGFANGVESFGEIASILAAAALVFGCLFLFVPRLSRRGWLIGAHATLGIAAYVFLSGYILLG